LVFIAAGILLLAITFLLAGTHELRPIPVQRDLVPVLAPAAAMRLADAYLDSLPKDKQPAFRIDARNDFLVWFFQGFIRPQGSGSPFSDAPTQAAFEAGQAYGRDHPSMRDEVMSGFGYVQTEVTGKWTRAFEGSILVLESAPDERLWLGCFRECESEIPSSRDHTHETEPIAVKVTGYLSPPGRYGHMGTWPRELLAAKIVREGG
jgi:hypothetical protein